MHEANRILGCRKFASVPLNIYRFPLTRLQWKRPNHCRHLSKAREALKSKVQILQWILIKFDCNKPGLLYRKASSFSHCSIPQNPRLSCGLSPSQCWEHHELVSNAHRISNKVPIWDPQPAEQLALKVLPAEPAHDGGGDGLGGHWCLVAAGALGAGHLKWHMVISERILKHETWWIMMNHGDLLGI